MDQLTQSTSKTSNETKWIYPLGYLLLAISFTLFIIIDYTLERNTDNFTVFFLHYFMAAGYAVFLVVHQSLGIMKSWRKEHIDKTIIVLNLFLISAYALNRQIPVFEDSADWFSVYILLTSLIALSYRFKSLPHWISPLQHIVLGSSLVLYAYLSIYVSNVYIFGAICTIAIGIGAHAFVPVFLLIGTIALLRHSNLSRVSLYSLAIGIAIPLIITVTFIIEWNSRVVSIERMANQSVLNANTELPVWARVGEGIKTDWITQRVLKSDLVYTASNHFSWFSFPGNVSWEETKKHDPLVFMASLVSKCSLTFEERVKILESITDNRHPSQERLWSGDNLSTSYIVSDVDIYPDLRLAYTEKYLSIRNNAVTKGRRRDSEEAIYTFQLPEGSVVTSLSLWINGHEEKSILTSKQKAREAYTTIVGREARDPSVLHWQERNTVSARIFPCTPQEERKFKIGITSPLPEREGKIIYKNSTFHGPNASSAKETVRVRFMNQPSELQIPKDFEKNNKGEYVTEHSYDPDLAITFSATPVRDNQFSFGGFTYSIAPLKPEMQSIKFEKIYLDINNSWSNDEIKELWPLISDREVYIDVEGEWIKLDNSNWLAITSDLLNRNFSLFPFHKVKEESHSLVISKGKELSPHLNDFKESLFAREVSNYFAGDHKIKLYSLGGDVSTYVSSFRELRGLEFTSGTNKQLKELLQKDQFPKIDESNEKIVLHDSHLIIRKAKTDSTLTLKNNAPDHLARLFAYNDIMRRVGANYFKDDFINEELVNEATTAYVVSPVSSLIVLETKADYERFGIKDSENSLHNASKQSSGAVPEPHEWALIVLFALLILYSTARKYQFRIQK